MLLPDESRKTLVLVVATLGPYYLNFVVDELTAILLRGYQRHVLAYTIHAMLAEPIPKIAIGECDGKLFLPQPYTRH